MIDIRLEMIRINLGYNNKTINWSRFFFFGKAICCFVPCFGNKNYRSVCTFSSV